MRVERARAHRDFIRAADLADAPHWGGGNVYIAVNSSGGSGELWSARCVGSVERIWDGPSRSFILILSGGPTTQLEVACPTANRFLVLELYVPVTDAFSFDVVFSTSNQRGGGARAPSSRRITFSSSYRSAHISPLFCKLPLGPLSRGTWVALTLDLMLAARECFREPFCALERLTIGGNCRLRRVLVRREKSDGVERSPRAGKRAAQAELGSGARGGERRRAASPRLAPRVQWWDAGHARAMATEAIPREAGGDGSSTDGEQTSDAEGVPEDAEAGARSLAAAAQQDKELGTDAVRGDGEPEEASSARGGCTSCSASGALEPLSAAQAGRPPPSADELGPRSPRQISACALEVTRTSRQLAAEEEPRALGRSQSPQCRATAPALGAAGRRRLSEQHAWEPEPEPAAAGDDDDGEAFLDVEYDAVRDCYVAPATGRCFELVTPHQPVYALVNSMTQ